MRRESYVVLTKKEEEKEKEEVKRKRFSKENPVVGKQTSWNFMSLTPSIGREEELLFLLIVLSPLLVRQQKFSKKH